MIYEYGSLRKTHVSTKIENEYGADIEKIDMHEVCIQTQKRNTRKNKCNKYRNRL